MIFTTKNLFDLSDFFDSTLSLEDVMSREVHIARRLFAFIVSTSLREKNDETTRTKEVQEEREEKA